MPQAILELAQGLQVSNWVGISQATLVNYPEVITMACRVLKSYKMMNLYTEKINRR